MTMTVRDEVREFLSESWSSDLPVEKWRELLADTGWGMPIWPREWFGRGLSREDTRAVAEEFAEAGAAGPPWGIAVMLAGPTILESGNDEQRARFLRPIVTGEDTWCQLFSEPGAGSDLAGVQTRAEKHGDEWIINGQKVWTSNAIGAKWGMLVARTDWDVPKHQGLTYFALDMQQPGIEVRPLRQMNGGASFNEVFISDARVPDENIIGGLNAGWGVALTTLAFERQSLGGSGIQVGLLPSRAQRQAAAAQAQQQFMPGQSVAGVKALAKAKGLDTDPVVRQQIMQLYCYQEVARLNGLRSRADAQSGKGPGPQGSIGKLTASRISRMSANLNAALAGADGLLGGTPVAGSLLGYHSTSIAGGTDDIQRNIVGERVLGLPKEPQVDRDIPFREVKGAIRKS